MAGWLVGAAEAEQWLAALACALLGVIAFLVSSNAQKRHAVRMREIEWATDLLEVHAKSLDAFLSASSPSMAMKRLAWNVSKTLGDPLIAMEMASAIGGQPLGLSVADEDTREVIVAFERLRHEDPDAARMFSHAVISGTFATILRWPESARMLSISAPSVMVDDSRGVAAALRATKARNEPRFDFGQREPVPAAC